MNATVQRRLTSECDCALHFDTPTRLLYATDASIYQITPLGVAFPNSAQQLSTLLRTAAEESIPIIPRGAGTGLAGGAIGEGLIVDLSRYNRRIWDFDAEKATVKVEAGVVLDQLNAFALPHGLAFGPDVATSSRASLGGMINNNSSGARAPIYGTTIDHVRSLDIALTDGRIETIGASSSSLSDIHNRVKELVDGCAADIDEHMPEGMVKRWPGYGLEQWLRDSPDLTKIIGGSEGTLAVVHAAELQLTPLPKQKGLCVIFFDSVPEAMSATVEILDLEPAAIEHIDRVLFDQTIGQLAFREARALLRLDDEPCESLLIVEFYDDTEGRIDTLMQRNLGLRREQFTDPHAMQQIWSLRKAGLSLLTGCKGAAKPTAGIEDVAIRPHQLPDYVAALRSLMEPLGLKGSFYGHAASGLLHVRPVVDLHRAEDVRKYRQLAEEVSALTKQFKGSIAAEHGVGIARTEFLADHLGERITQTMTEIKALFDPKNLLNPGKLISDGRYAVDTNLRQGADNEIPLPFKPELAFAAKDGSFIGNLEQCNGCGGCRKDAPTMCPTYLVTGDEAMSTRGRANIIRAALEGHLDSEHGLLRDAALEEALATCLSCKACTLECPSNVNLALLKAELNHAHIRAHGLPFGKRIVSRVDLIGALGTLAPGLANVMMGNSLVRRLLEKHTGLSVQRPLPHFTHERFDRWFNRAARVITQSENPTLLWDDCFVRYYDPQIGKAATTLLETAGSPLALPGGRACCGRPAFSMGRLELARQFAEYNVKLLNSDQHAGRPIVFLEPSCYSMFVDEYAELSIPGAQELAKRCYLFEEYLEGILEKDEGALSFDAAETPVSVHRHCHAKALTTSSCSHALLRRVAGTGVTILDTGCCGMAGAFGAMRETYDLSVKVGDQLAETIYSAEQGSTLIASGTSCRAQIEHLTDLRAVHTAEFLAAHLSPNGNTAQVRRDGGGD